MSCSSIKLCLDDLLTKLDPYNTIVISKQNFIYRYEQLVSLSNNSNCTNTFDSIDYLIINSSYVFAIKYVENLNKNNKINIKKSIEKYIKDIGEISNFEFKQFVGIYIEKNNLSNKMEEYDLGFDNKIIKIVSRTNINIIEWLCNILHSYKVFLYEYDGSAIML